MTLRRLVVPSKLKYKFKTEPFSHQRKALEKIRRLDGKCALFMEMGTGKTKVAIDWAGIGFHNFGLRRVLVVAPLSVLGVWPNQIRLHSNVPSKIYRLRGSTVERSRTLTSLLRVSDQESHLTWLIINYEGIWREPDRGPSIEKLLVAWQPDLIVFDESHRIKSPSAKQSKAAARIAKTVPQRLLLTGTPITKSPLDAFGQFRALDPTILGDNWYHFKYYYGVWGGFGNYQLRGYRHLEELNLKLHKHSFKVKKVDCLDLPPKLFETVPITLPDRIAALYNQMAREMIIEIEDTHATAAVVVVKLIRLSQITSGFVKDVDGNIRVFDNTKLNTCLDLVDDIVSEDKKVVIFCRFIEDIRRLSAGLTKRKIEFRILSGSVPPERRDSIVSEFHDDPNLKVFISQIQAGSLGIDLTPADTAIFYSLDYNAANYWQAQDRLHRQGQTRSVTYYHLVVPRTIDSVVLKVLQEKGQLAAAVLKNPRVLIGEKLTLYN
jgi:SNF2 family DNA or RNA helicase